MRILQIIGAVLLVFAAPAMAKDGGDSAWVVTQKSGEVHVLRSGVQPASVLLRTSLSPGDVVATGPTGRVMLTHGGDYVVVAPGSRLVLPKEEQPTGFTRLIQQVGTMLYKVRHTGVPHFEVDTPMLAAVVKGTSFTIVVDENRAAVQVTDGIVDVSALTGSARRLVERGMTVYIGRERPNEIIEVKPGTFDLPGSESGGKDPVHIERSGDVPLATVTDLTGGLVRATPAAPTTEIATAPATDLIVATTGSEKPGTDVAGTTAPPVTEPVTEIVETTVPAITDPVVDIVDSTVPAVTEPVVEIVDTTIPAITEPVVEIVDTTIPAITEPVVEIVDTVIPAITEPVVEIVDTTVPAITEPVIDIVETTVPTITQPVVEIVDTTIPAITEPVVDIVETTVPTITEPVVEIVDTTIPAITEPVVDIVETAVPTITGPVTGLIGGLLK